MITFEFKVCFFNFNQLKLNVFFIQIYQNVKQSCIYGTRASKWSTGRKIISEEEHLNTSETHPVTTHLQRRNWNKQQVKDGPCTRRYLPRMDSAQNDPCARSIRLSTYSSTSENFAEIEHLLQKKNTWRSLSIKSVILVTLKSLKKLT